MGPAITERMVAVAQQLRGAAHGQRGALVEAAARELGMAPSTLLRKLKAVTITPPRKRRSDAGSTALSFDEAMALAALRRETTRQHGKRLSSTEQALEVARGNQLVKAERIDMETGEVKRLSASSVNRALKKYGVHHEQLAQPAPVTQLASKHPNHVWQIDASQCVLYYLKPEKAGGKSGLHVMAQAEFNKNKPKNLEKIKNERLWRYCITDHTTGWIYVEYVLGGETGENVCTVLIHAMQSRGGADLMHGVPAMLMMDPGSANISAMALNLMRALGIEAIINQVGNARAKGQVENANNLVECNFEPGLRFHRVNSLDEINALAAKWRVFYNDTKVHSRHRMTRNAAWRLIKADQLILAPSEAVCKELAVASPEERRVTPALQISFKGSTFDVSRIPGVLVGEKLRITRNAWRDDAAQVLLVGEDGRERYQLIPRVEVDQWGFAESAAIISENFKRHADTPAQTAAKAIERLITGTDTQEEAEAVRKAGSLPFDGQVNFYKAIDEAVPTTYLPARGTAHELIAPVVEAAPLSQVEAAMQLKRRLEDAGGEWTPERFQWLQQRYPQGVPADAIDAIAKELTGPRAGHKAPLQLIRAAGGM